MLWCLPRAAVLLLCQGSACRHIAGVFGLRFMDAARDPRGLTATAFCHRYCFFACDCCTPSICVCALYLILAGATSTSCGGLEPWLRGRQLGATGRREAQSADPLGQPPADLNRSRQRSLLRGLVAEPSHTLLIMSVIFTISERVFSSPLQLARVTARETTSKTEIRDLRHLTPSIDTNMQCASSPATSRLRPGFNTPSRPPPLAARQQQQRRSPAQSLQRMQALSGLSPTQAQSASKAWCMHEATLTTTHLKPHAT